LVTVSGLPMLTATLFASGALIRNCAPFRIDAWVFLAGDVCGGGLPVVLPLRVLSEDGARCQQERQQAGEPCAVHHGTSGVG
jgi:hypothetical protein